MISHNRSSKIVVSCTGRMKIVFNIQNLALSSNPHMKMSLRITGVGKCCPLEICGPIFMHSFLAFVCVRAPLSLVLGCVTTEVAASVSATAAGGGSQVRCMVGTGSRFGEWD